MAVSGRKSLIDKMPMDEIRASLSPKQLEFGQLVKTGKTDPVFFAENLLDIKLHDGQKYWLWMTTQTQLDKAFETGLKLSLIKDRKQFDEILTSCDFKKNILVPSNRWGKTLVTSGVKHIWYNFYKIGVRGSPSQIAMVRCATLNISPHSNQCQAGFDYILDILQSKFLYTIDGESRRNQCKIEWFYSSDSSQKRQISFKNGTIYRAIPTGEDQAASLAGTSYLYISYDECAQSLHLKAELPAKIMSRLIDYGGPMDLVSTPEVDKPSHQYFHHIAKLGLENKEGWFTMVGKITDNVFLSQKEVKKTLEAIKTTDPAKYRQVKYGEFVTTGKKMFDSLLIERIWDSHVPDNVLYQHQYLVTADWGFSDTGDPTVFYVLDYTDLLNENKPKHLRRIRIAYRESIHGGSPFAVLARAKILQREWNGAKFLHDSTAMGGVIIRKMLQEMNMTDLMDFSAQGDKSDMLFCLQLVLSANRQVEIDKEGKVKELNPDFGRLRGYHIPELEEQLGNYQYNPEKGISDKRLTQDDVMSLGMGIWWLERRFMKNTVKQLNFNPFASTLEQVIPAIEAKKIGMKILTIPEKRIL